MARLMPAVQRIDRATDCGRTRESKAGRLPRVNSDPVPEAETTSGAAGRDALGDDVLGGLGWRHDSLGRKLELGWRRQDEFPPGFRCRRDDGQRGKTYLGGS